MMNNLFDMLSKFQDQATQAQASIPEQMAKQFGLQQQQAEKAIEALMPAFSQGLKRNAATPKGFAGFMEALASGNHADYMQNPMKAFSPQGMNEGNAILGHLFGNKDISRAVAAQAEAASGVSQSIIKQMLPALAPLIMGGLFKQMTGQATQAAQPQAQHFGSSGGGILGQILEEMMKGGLGGGLGGGMGGGMAQPRQQQQPRAKNPLEEILEQMTKGGFGGGLGGGMGGGQSQNPSGNPGGPLGDIFNEMLKNGPLGGGMGGGYPAPETEKQPERPDLDDVYGRSSKDAPETESDDYSPYPRGTGLEDLFGDLFKPAQNTSKQYEKGIQDIFDQFIPKK